MGNYPSFENRTGEVLDQVEANSRYLTNNGVFDQDTMVTIAAVELYATNAYYYVVGSLFANGYGTTPANAAVKSILTNIQALHTSVQVETSIPVDERGQPNVRHRTFSQARDQLVNLFIVRHALDQLGQVRAAEESKAAFLELTGRSISRKDTIYEDTDIPQSRFARGWQRTSIGTKQGTTSDDEDED